jgi:hypothetical protein
MGVARVPMMPGRGDGVPHWRKRGCVEEGSAVAPAGKPGEDDHQLIDCLIALHTRGFCHCLATRPTQPPRCWLTLHCAITPWQKS